MSENIENNSGGFLPNMVPNSVLFNRKGNIKKGSRCPLSGKNAPNIDYKNLALLSQYVSEKGRVLPRRITEVCAKKQRELLNAIKRARNLALLPFTVINK